MINNTEKEKEDKEKSFNPHFPDFSATFLVLLHLHLTNTMVVSTLLLQNSRRFTMTHRPTPSPVPSRNRVVPLMQTFNFRTSTPRDARLDVSTIDYAVMPSFIGEAEREAAAAASRMALRVPLLPDNFSPDRQNLDGHAPEVADGPLASPQIVVVAAHPENIVAASALTEIEGMGVDGVELKFAHLGAETSGSSSSKSDSDSEPGMIRDLWKGLMDDLAGPAVPKTA